MRHTVRSVGGFGQRLLGVASALAAALLILGYAWIAHQAYVAAQEGDAAGDGAPPGEESSGERKPKQIVPPDCYEDPDLGYLVVCPAIAINGLASSVPRWGSDTFTVRATGLTPWRSYTLRLRKQGSGSPSGTCGNTTETTSVPSGRKTHNWGRSLSVCDASEWTVTASLRHGSRTIKSASRTVTVTAPPTPTPTPMPTPTPAPPTPTPAPPTPTPKPPTPTPKPPTPTPKPPTPTPKPTPTPTPAPTPTPTPTAAPTPTPTPTPPTVSVALVNGPPLAGAIEAGAAGWVLGQAIATVTEQPPAGTVYQYRLVIPASTGLQVNDANSRECQWHLTSPTTTVKLRSAWVSPGKGIRLLRCGLGAGAAASVEVQRRLGGNGAPSTIQTLAVTVPRAVHQADEQVAYYICGTTASGITAVADGDCEGFFPLTGMPTGHPLSAATVASETYSTAAQAWTGATVGAGVSRVTGKGAADVTVRGVWAKSGNNSDGKCDDSVACVSYSPPDSDRHLGTATIWIEEPPWLPHPKTGTSVKWSWTNDFKLANLSVSSTGPYFEYLPAVMMHEFGHVLGLDDTRIPDIIMGPAALELERLTPTDTSAAKAIYPHHAPH